MGSSAVAGDGDGSGSGSGLGLLLGASAGGGDDSASAAGDTSGSDESGGDSDSLTSGCVTLALLGRDFRLASDLARARREKLKLARVESVGRLQPPEERRCPGPGDFCPSWLLVALPSVSEAAAAAAALALRLRNRGMRGREARDKGIPVKMIFQ